MEGEGNQGNTLEDLFSKLKNKIVGPDVTDFDSIFKYSLAAVNDYHSIVGDVTFFIDVLLKQDNVVNQHQMINDTIGMLQILRAQMKFVDGEKGIRNTLIESARRVQAAEVSAVELLQPNAIERWLSSYVDFGKMSEMVTQIYNTGNIETTHPHLQPEDKVKQLDLALEKISGMVKKISEANEKFIKSKEQANLETELRVKERSGNIGQKGTEDKKNDKQPGSSSKF